MIMQMESPPIEVDKEALLRITKGRRFLMLGGVGARPEHRKAIIQHLELDHLEWVTHDHHQSAVFAKVNNKLAAGQYDMLLVLIRWTRKGSKHCIKAATELGIPVVRLPGGYSPNTVAEAILNQVSPEKMPPRKEREPAHKPSARAPETVIERPSYPAHEEVSPTPEEPETEPAVITDTMRAATKVWMQRNPTKSFAGFKVHFPYQIMDHSYWSDLKRAQDEKAATYLGKDPWMAKSNQTDSARVKEFLLKLSSEERAAMSHKRYMEETNHKITPSIFNTMKSNLKRQGDPVKRAYTRAAPGKKGGSKAAVKYGTTYEVFATIDMDRYSGAAGLEEQLENFAVDLTRQIHPQGDKVQIVRLRSPNAMEIRVPA